MTKPRMSITFTEPQMKFLKAQAEGFGTSTADAVRRIIDIHRDEGLIKLVLALSKTRRPPRFPRG